MAEANWKIDFESLQKRLPAAWQSVRSDPNCERTVVVLPSISLAPLELAKVQGSVHYEERLLSFLTLLGMPKTQVVYLSALRIPDDVISYYLQFLPGVTFSHARERLHLISLMDRSDIPLTQKILERPAVIERIKRAITNPALSYMEVYYNTDLEHELAVKLGIPIYGSSGDLRYWGGKSGSRDIFKKLDIAHPKGRGSIFSMREAAQAIIDLRSVCPNLEGVVIKLNEGFSGIGNILVKLADMGSISSKEEIADYLENLSDGNCGEVSCKAFKEVLADQGGVVEAFIDAPGKTSPTVQIFINPLGEINVDSTHEQQLGGRSGLEYIGCSLPAKAEYVQALHHLGKEIGRELVRLGYVGPVSIDFIAIPRKTNKNKGLIDGVVYSRGDYELYAVEINLRRGGTTHPLNATSFLTGGKYSTDSGSFKTPSGRKIYYVSFSNIAPPEAKGLCPNDIIDIVTEYGLHYNSATCCGVVFHMMGALSQYGRLSGTCIADSPEKAWQLVDTTRTILAKQASELSWLQQ
ncbi:MAG: peptide ligase PGM1-related protein [Candidatus Bruticola sp.]